MSHKKKPSKKASDWAEAQRRCRLSQEEVAMAKELGMGAAALIHNIPNPRERWKAPVADWVRELYRKKFGNRRPATLASTGSATATARPDKPARRPPESETTADFTRPTELPDLDAP